MDVDPDGAVELMRWTLRRDAAADLYEESRELHFEKRDAFRDWLDAFRTKAAG